MKSAILLTCAHQVFGAGLRESACNKEDVANRVQFQNKLAGVCEDMCKEVGAYPQCSECPEFVAPDATPGVMTWPELLEHMDNLVDWGRGELKGWRSRASKLLQMQSSCAKQEHAVFALISEKSRAMGVVCEDMCKRTQAPTCQCAGFGGQPASDGDTRACMVKYCKDPAQGGSPCPNDAFVTCVDEKCKSIMSFAQVMSAVDTGFHAAKQTALMQKPALAQVSTHTVSEAKATFNSKVQALKKANPLFSKETCTNMFATKLKLGGSVPPSGYVVGCTEVCKMAKDLKEYWKSGEMGSFACAAGHDYGCVYDGTPPVQLSGIGC